MAGKSLKILVLCYDFPPLPSIGSHRPASWMKYFPESDIYPIVITRKWNPNIKSTSDYFKIDAGNIEKEVTDQYELIRIPISGKFRQWLYASNSFFKVFLRKMLTLFESICKWRITAADSKRAIYKAADHYLANNDVDCILATGEPFILFHYAQKLSKKYNIPFVVDYRDGWSTDHAGKNWLENLITKGEYKREKRILNDALFYTAASDEIIRMNNDLFVISGGYVHENGTDVSNILKIGSSHEEKPNDKFIITFSGSLYNEHNLKDYLQAIEELSNEQESLRTVTRFVGIDLKPSDSSRHVNDFSKKNPGLIEIIPPVAHEEAIKYLFDSQLLLKFDYTGQSKGLLGAKLYEYAATRKPILTVLSVDDKETPFFPDKKVQFMVCNKEEIKESIKKLYDQYMQFGELTTDLTDDEIHSFSRKYYVNQFAKEIKSRLRK